MPILGVPIIERIIENLASNGLNDFIIVAQPNDRQLIRHFRYHSTIDVQVRLVFQHQPRGTADALSQAAPLIKGAFMLSACDSLVNAQDIGRLISTWGSNPRLDAVLALMPVSDKHFKNSGIVEMNGESIRRIIEKPATWQTHSNISSLPLYCFSPRILDFLKEVPLSPRGEYEIQDAIQMLIDDHLPTKSVFIDQRLPLTNPEDLLKINKFYLKNDIAYAKSSYFRIGSNCQLIPPFHIEYGTVIGEGCSIGPFVYIEKNCRIGDRVRLQNVVLLEGITLANDANITGKVVL